jgi:hypothetical protein
MAFGAVILLLPVILSIHNIDEYAQHRGFAHSYQSRLPARFRTRRVFAWSATLLTIAVAALCLLTYVHENPTLQSTAAVAIFALSWNAVGHCTLSAIRRSLLPGTRSAGALVLPYSGAAIFVMHTTLGLSFETLLGYAALGAVVLPLAAMTSLSLGYALSRLTAPA